MEQPLVSIIVASYNQGKYIPQCMESIISQTYRNIELITTDDASTDNTRDMFQQYLQMFPKKVKFVFNDKNIGLANTLNKAIPLVSGKYVKIIAADDFLHPLSIKKCVDALENAGDEFGMVFTDFFTVDDNSAEIKPHIDYQQLPDIFENNILRKEALLIRNRIIAPSTLIRADIWKKTGAYDESLIMEDYDRWFRISRIKKILFIPEKLCYYRRHISNLSQSGHSGMSMDDIYLKIINDNQGLIKNLVNKRIAGLYISKSLMPKKLIDAYSKYPYRTKSLSFLLKNRIPPFYYRMYFNLRYGKN